MSDDQRRALVLRYVDSSPGSEVAEELGVPVEKVYSILKRGKKTLREDLEGELGA